MKKILLTRASALTIATSVMGLATTPARITTQLPAIYFEIIGKLSSESALIITLFRQKYN